MGFFSKKAKKKKGSSVLPCEQEKPPGAIVVAVIRQDNGRGMSNVSVALTGPDGSTKNKKTDHQGWAIFPDLEPGSYSYTADFTQPLLTQRSGSGAVSSGNITKLQEIVKPVGKLIVSVKDEEGQLVPDYDRILSARYSAQSIYGSQNNPFTFDNIKPGKYSVAVRVGDYVSKYVDATVPEWDETTADILVKARHWIGVRVKDEKGNPVSDIKPSVTLNNGQVIQLTLDKGYAKTKKIMEEESDCRVFFPDMFDMEWWLESEGGARPDVGPPEPVKEGDCVSSVAAEIGLRNYTSIWDRSANKALKQKRLNPNMLSKGDLLAKPMRKGIKRATCGVDTDWTFVVKAKEPVTLKIKLLKDKNTSVTNTTWTGTNGLGKGQVDRQGMVQIDNLPATLKKASLKVLLPPPRGLQKAPPEKPVPPPRPGQEAPYPPPIDAAHFKDTNKLESATKNLPNQMLWELNIGSLGAVDGPQNSGLKARLHNLGFACAPYDNGAADSISVKAYQQLYLDQSDGSGAFNDIKADLQKRHDKAG